MRTIVALVVVTLWSETPLAAQNPGGAVSNPHGELALPCAMCHDAAGWKPVHLGPGFDHASFGMALEGAHKATACRNCHQSLDFKETPRTCGSCHRDPHVGALGPGCARCHTTRSFGDQAGMLRLHQQSRFPLEGPHTLLDCEQCHNATGQGALGFTSRPTECFSCHAASFRATTDPDHTRGAFPRDCTACHTGATWEGARFDHGTTGFALTGAHAAGTCQDCHGDGIFAGRDAACVACHLAQFAATRSPDHAAAGLPTDCSACHGTTVWSGAGFDHGATRFPLTGSHMLAGCLDCHGDAVYRGKDMECVSCHRGAYDQAIPDHRSLPFPTTCAGCHSTATWHEAHFDHSLARFTLTGAHLATGCQDCHGGGVYRGTPQTCVGCHQTDYDGTTVPAHGTLGFSTDCTACHTTVGWAGAKFDHSMTQFALSGAHLAATCADCHGDGIYTGKSTACVSCHQAAYDGTTSPAHAAAGFSTDCATCHTTVQWPGASYNHGATGFPLTGAHLQATCSQCHGDGIYDGKSVLCVSCHLAEYNATTDPSHTGARFPTFCESCHSTSLWSGARFEHDADYFPIYTGAHAGKWASCATCHLTAANYATFSCLGCHEHDQVQMDDKHKAIPGYQYTSAACLSCHPRGVH